MPKNRKNNPYRVKARRQSALNRIQARLNLPDKELLKLGRGRTFSDEEVGQYRKYLKDQKTILEERVKSFR